MECNNTNCGVVSVEYNQTWQPSVKNTISRDFVYCAHIGKCCPNTDVRCPIFCRTVKTPTHLVPEPDIASELKP